MSKVWTDDLELFAVLAAIFSLSLIFIQSFPKLEKSKINTSLHKMISNKGVDMFDALGYIKKLEELGVKREVAELQVKMHMDIYNSEIVTHKDMNLLSSHFYQEAEKLKAEFALLRSEFEAFKSEMKIEFAQFKEEMRNELTVMKLEIKELGHKVDNMENRMTIKLGIMMTAVMGIYTLLLKGL